MGPQTIIKISVNLFASAKMTEKLLHMLTLSYFVEVRNENVNELDY